MSSFLRRKLDILQIHTRLRKKIAGADEQQNGCTALNRSALPMNSSAVNCIFWLKAWKAGWKGWKIQ
jgi:hypothetical protein